MPSVALKQAEAPLVLAIDVGTTSVRAELYDRQARSVEGHGIVSRDAARNVG